MGGLIVFGVPAVKDGRGSAADDPAGISQLALADLRAEVGDACVIMADLCMCEYTDHGHCGLLTPDGDVSFNGTTNTLGTLLDTATFPAGRTNATVGPVLNTVGTALTADAQQYMITFSAPIESANDTIQTTTAIPEPSTWAMMLLGFAGLGFVSYRKAKSRRTEPSTA